jgi:hypothetical protein
VGGNSRTWSFPLILDPYINSVQFERVLVAGGSSIDILFLQQLACP